MRIGGQAAYTAMSSSDDRTEKMMLRKPTFRRWSYSNNRPTGLRNPAPGPRRYCQRPSGSSSTGIGAGTGAEPCSSSADFTLEVGFGFFIRLLVGAGEVPCSSNLNAQARRRRPSGRRGPRRRLRRKPLCRREISTVVRCWIGSRMPSGGNLPTSPRNAPSRTVNS